ncbi:nitroreductase family protein [Methanococcoides burtonii]|uniref:FMN-utilising oxidoreductase n=1 Tax=Methanococcoides burtonii (strain DSM 6242 / NBRC 107633 / OCM 468 / ACE-M) TaxID=259564 RepID=Q12Y04_METBU|nr:nitroreductase [Methanococcoides burtonii]ABE51672.1 FMN-utilising oxidoreductase [Methanococcoides burtonii DSM 6242]
MSTTIETILSRRSVREYTDEPVSEKDINTILDCARWAPSGLNNQPWKFIVIQDENTIKDLAQCTHYSTIVLGSKLLIAVYLDNSEMYHHDKDVMAIGASIQNMLLACVELGLGSVWLGEILKQAEKVNSILEVPEIYELMAVIAIGKPVKKERTSSRKSVSELTFKNKFDNKWTGSN